MSRIDLIKWNNVFLKEVKNNINKIRGSDTQRTNLIYKIIHEDLTANLNYKKDCICKLNKGRSKEYLGMDFSWVDDSSYEIPDLIIELENDNNVWYNLYCVWKLFCHKCKSKILITFSTKKLEILKEVKTKFPLAQSEEFLLIFGDKFQGIFVSYLMRSKNDIEKLNG